MKVERKEWAFGCRTNIKCCDFLLSNFELLSSNVKWPPSDARDDQVLLTANSQATSLETHTSAHTQSACPCKPQLVEALSDTPHINPLIYNRMASTLLCLPSPLQILIPPSEFTWPTSLATLRAEPSKKRTSSNSCMVPK